MKELDSAGVPAIRDGGRTARTKRAAAIVRFALYLHSLEEVARHTTVGKMLLQVVNERPADGLPPFKKLVGKGTAIVTYETGHIPAEKKPARRVRGRGVVSAHREHLARRGT